MKSFGQARLKYRTKPAQAKLDAEARDKGKAKLADEREIALEEDPYGLHTAAEQEVALEEDPYGLHTAAEQKKGYGAIRIGKSGCDMKRRRLWHFQHQITMNRA